MTASFVGARCSLQAQKVRKRARALGLAGEHAAFARFLQIRRDHLPNLPSSLDPYQPHSHCMSLAASKLHVQPVEPDLAALALEPSHFDRPFPSVAASVLGALHGGMRLDRICWGGGSLCKQARAKRKLSEEACMTCFSQFSHLQDSLNLRGSCRRNT